MPDNRSHAALLAPLLAEHAAPQHATKADVHAQIGPVLKAAAAIQRQMLEYRSLMTEIELADHDHSVDGKLEHFRQTFGAAEREVHEFVEAGRRLARTFTQLDRYVAEQRALLGAASTATTDGTSATR